MSDQIIDVEQLLAPISEENPTGEELSLSDPGGAFLKIKDAFDEAKKLVKEERDRELSGGVDSFGQPWRTIPAPDWNTVIDLATATLTNVSKDFRIASWLTEALLRKYNIRGLRDGLLLCQGLCDRYWDNIHPPANEEDGHGRTVGGFSGLDTASASIFDTVIVQGTKANERTPRRYRVIDYMRAKERVGSAKPQEAEEGSELIDVAEIKALAEQTPPEFFTENLADVDSCISTLNALDDFLRANCREDQYGEPTSPAIVGIRTQLETVKRLITELSGGETVEAGGDELIEGGGQLQVHGGQPGMRQEMTREAAFRAIEDIAKYFERTEPHTPVHFALRKVVRWGRMPLPELLAELIEDGGSMESLRKLIGLPQDKQD